MHVHAPDNGDLVGVPPPDGARVPFVFALEKGLLLGGHVAG